VARATAIDILPDDALLQIFDFCGVGHNPLQSPFRPVLDWRRLIHVCRRWRQIIFSSPCRLDLYLLCKQGTPVRKNLGLWPAFPIVVHYADYPHRISSHDEDNIIAALEHPDRVRRLKIPVTSSLLDKVATMAPEPFPVLTQLWLVAEYGSVLTLPSAFLGGSAPRLREIHLEGVFPTLPTLLSSSSDLVVLYLHRIPYISAAAMVASLAALTRLHDLSIDAGFQLRTYLGQSGSSRNQVATPARVVLPSLTFFRFQGASAYLEDLVAQIGAPCLASIRIKCFNELVFQLPQLFRFISQTQNIERAHMMDAEVHFYRSYVQFSIFAGLAPRREVFLDLEIVSQGLDSQVSHLSEALSQTSTVLSNVHYLFILMDSAQPGRDSVDNIEWLALFRRFTAVHTLRISYGMARPIADALKDVTAAMAPEILPALRLLQLIGEGAGCVEEFITARQLSGLPPVTIRY